MSKKKLYDEKYKETEWDNGRLIEENHGTEKYSESFTIKLKDRLFDYLQNPTLQKIYTYKDWMIKLLVFWNNTVKKDNKYFYIKNLLEDYWNDKFNDNN